MNGIESILGIGMGTVFLESIPRKIAQDINPAPTYLILNSSLDHACGPAWPFNTS